MDTNQPEPERLQQPIALDNTDFPLESHITAATLSSQSEPSEKAKDERSMSSPSKETYDRGSLSNLEAAQEMEDDLSSFDPDSPAMKRLKKLGPRLWIPFVMLAWGIVSMSMAAVTNGSGLLASRFFLGLAESGYAPAPVYIISLWYRRNEQALRIGFFYSASMIAGAFGGLVAYVIGKLHNLGGLTGWQWIFIIEGLPTIFSALVAFWVLPDFPETSTFLSPEERNLLIQNIRMDVGPATDRKLTWKRFCATFRDWKIYAFAFTAMLHSVTFASLGVFVPSITLGFGFE
ncbi:hypothetical protein BGW38_005499 [Lunasporangiospora selenospora]|uniref:Major facilitator superfamily (MFS) profile domain-containing protein n=1 Tax=Lunasporangiospora selenospora TaxID=979761 RepID=A0A9P6FNQ6_9FUNG|nr:hypothetical protein BGW38_005499 [Lunasporangiospora selenospora]